MIELVYESSTGEKLNLTKLPYLLNVEPIFDYEWDYTEREKRRSSIIAGFTKKISNSKFVLHIIGDTEQERNEAIDRFNSVIEADIYNGKAGKIWCGEWYTYGYIISAENEKWQYGVPVVKKNIQIAKEKDSWYRSIIKRNYESDVFNPQPEAWDKNYDPYRYEYDYMADFETRIRLLNPDSLPSNFKLSIQGAAERPEIHIGSNVIQFNYNVGDGEVLVVDATQKTTLSYRPDGEVMNVFGTRNPDYYIFERIASGINTITWNGAFNWEIELFEERSEPRWLTV